ncbi:hypothetical protein [Pseudomonas sp. SG20052]|uniref:hypothetical protein n=1 Tax=Pseudomonas sp. SG20052 TaxID=3074147 RepID=UPI00287F52FF|nr:hypothetical protein [Pseudomonas sp. SG20052]WNF55371.1 hypothetical protein RHP74_29535 [Pseudomonas sp. SG20052]
MKMRTLDNAKSRITWLRRIIAGDYKPTKLECSKLINLREFCTLETATYKPTSYNSLKNASQAILYNPQENSYPSAWYEIKSLRESAWNISLEKVKKSNPKISNNDNFKEQAKSCLLHAQLCSLAYFELLTQINSLIRPGNRRIDEKSKLAINQVIQNSRAKFDSIVSTVPNPNIDPNIVWLNERR